MDLAGVAGDAGTLKSVNRDVKSMDYSQGTEYGNAGAPTPDLGTDGMGVTLGSSAGPWGTAIGAAVDIGSEVVTAVMKYQAAKKQEKENKRIERLNRALQRDEREYNRMIEAEERERQKQIDKQNKALAQYNQYYDFVDKFIGMLNRSPQVATAMQEMWRR